MVVSTVVLCCIELTIIAQYLSKDILQGPLCSNPSVSEKYINHYIDSSSSQNPGPLLALLTYALFPQTSSLQSVYTTQIWLSNSGFGVTGTKPTSHIVYGLLDLINECTKWSRVLIAASPQTEGGSFTHQPASRVLAFDMYEK